MKQIARNETMAEWGFLTPRAGYNRSNPMLGPRSPTATYGDERGLRVSGTWQGIRFVVSLVLAASDLA